MKDDKKETIVKALKLLISNYAYHITDENLNKWHVVEVSDIEDIIQSNQEDND